MKAHYDAVVVGAGPNGLGAAITIAKRGGAVLVLEGADSIGGGARSSELTLPGFLHDDCSAVHPLGMSSPFFRGLPLAEYGLEWIHSRNELAHPLDDGSAVLLKRSLSETAAGLEKDAAAYLSWMAPFVKYGDALIEEAMRPVVHWPRHPFMLARFGLSALRSAEGIAKSHFHGIPALALFAGLGAHAAIPLSSPGSAAIGLVLGMAAHLRGWPIPRGGSGRISEALAGYLRSLGGEIRTGAHVKTLEELPLSRWVFLDITPKQFAEIGAKQLTESAKRRLRRFHYGVGSFKMDFALGEPIPWKAPECGRAAMLHLGGSLPEIVASEAAVHAGKVREKPFVFLAQPSLFDPSRAPPGQHTVWAYCHVPNGYEGDVSDAIENQIERFAPGFKARILGRRITRPADLEKYNPNYVGGDIGGGALNLAQIIARPRFSSNPYATSIRNVFLCSSSTPPGPGVHGMCGHLAALAALGEIRRAFGSP